MLLEPKHNLYCQKKQLIFKKLLLCATLFSSVLVNQSYSDTLKRKGEQKVSGELKLFYYTIEKEDSEFDAYTTAVGGYLDYRSASLYDISANVRFYTSQPVGADRLRETTLLYQTPGGESITTLAIANLSYQNDSTKVTVGRQRLFTPMANDDTTRIVPFAYLGTTVSNNTLENVKINAGYINKIKHIVDESFSSQTPAGEVENGFYFLGINGDLPWKIQLQTYGYYADELYDAMHLQIEKRFDIDAVAFNIGGQYIKTWTNGNGSNLTPESNSGSDQVSLWAYKIAMKYYKLTLSHALSKNEDNGGIVRGYGGYTKVYTSSMYETAKSQGGPKGLNFTAKYDFLENLGGEMTYLKTTYDDPNANGYVSLYAGLKYYYHEKSYIHARYETVDRDHSGTDANYFRLIATYVF